MLVVALVAVAAVAHATWNLAIKRAGASGVELLWPAFVLGAIVFAPFGIVSLASTGTALGPWLGFAVVSGALQVGYFLLLQHAYRVGDASLVYPLARGTGPLLSVVFAIVLFHERPSTLGLVGAALVVVGVVVVGLAGGRRALGARRAGSLLGLGVGVLIAAYTLWDANAVTAGSMPAVGLYWGSVTVQALLLAPAALRGRDRVLPAVREHAVAIVLVGVLSPLAYILILLAIQLAPVSVVAPAREVSIVLIALAGWLWLKEPHPAQRLLGAAIVLGGVALLAV